MQEVVIVAARRTAVGAFGGSLAGIPASDLGAAVIKDVIARTGIKPEEVDELDRRIIQLKIEESALSKETDTASKDRLSALREELANLEQQSL